MSLERLESRLRRIEAQLAPSRPRAATILHLQPSEDAAPISPRASLPTATGTAGLC
jgi:hypothetical protein